MAWTEQCKIAFRMNALGKLSKYKNKNRKVAGVLKELSKESDIPQGTLKKWYYDKSDNSIRSENATDKSIGASQPIETPTCSRCHQNPVYTPPSGKPLSIESKYYGLCNSCRINQRRIANIDREATDLNLGLMTVCPYCEKPHYINIEPKYDRKKGVKNARDIT